MPEKNESTDCGSLETMADLLRRRLKVIADTPWRDRDPEGHLGELRTVSEEIMALHQSLAGRIHPRLEHFLANASYGKALDYLENELSS